VSEELLVCEPGQRMLVKYYGVFQHVSLSYNRFLVGSSLDMRTPVINPLEYGITIVIHTVLLQDLHRSVD